MHEYLKTHMKVFYALSEKRIGFKHLLLCMGH